MRNTLKHLLAATALGAMAMTVQASAQTEPGSDPAPEQAPQPVALDDAEALAVDAKMYAAEFGVSYDEALQRMTVMVYGRDATADAAIAEGGDLAGRYFDNKAADFGLIVVTKKAAKADRTLSFTPATKANYGRATAAAKQERNAARKAARTTARLTDEEVRKAEDKLSGPVAVKVKYKTGQAHSLAELKGGMDKLGRIGRDIPGLTALSVDEAGNSIRVFTTAALPAEKEAEIRRTAGVAVAFDVIPGGFVPAANMRGGSKLYRFATDTSSSSRDCMTAFGARSTTLKNSAGVAMTGMITAAHCAPTTYVIADDGRNKPLTTPNSSHVSDTRGGTNQTDIRFVYAASGDPVGLGTFYYDGTTNLRSVSGTQSRSGTAVGGGDWVTVSGTAMGSYICHLGQTTPGSTASVQSCGEVISVTAAQSSDGNWAWQNGGNYVMVRNTSTGKGSVLGPTGSGTLRCYRGDSGGPWFAGTIAYGVLSSCAWEGGIENSNRAIFSLYTSTDFLHMTGASIIVP